MSGLRLSQGRTADTGKRTARKGEPRKDSKNRTVRTGQAERDGQNDMQNRTVRTVLPGQDGHYWTTSIQDGQDRAAQDRTASTWLPVQNC